MAKALTKSQIAAAIAEKNSLTKKQAVEILEQLVAPACKHAKDLFVIPGLGRLVLVNRKARVGRSGDAELHDRLGLDLDRFAGGRI